MKLGRILCVFALAGCGPEPEIAEIVAAFSGRTVTYANEIQPLLGNYCVACHTSEGVRIGGIELDTYQTAYAGRIHNACVSMTVPVIAHFGESLKPTGEAACSYPNIPAWAPYSMPKGASRSGMTLEEQVLFGMWIAGGAPP